MDRVHQETTKTLPNACPPRFEYTWKNDKTLIMKYMSKRGLIDFMSSLVRGVGRHYKEDLKVTKISPDTVEIVFAK